MVKIMGYDTEKNEPFKRSYTQTSTDALANIATLPFLLYSKLVLQITCITNDVNWKILASNDLTSWTTLQAEQQIVADAIDEFSLTDAWSFIAIQIKSTVAEAHGVATLVAVMKRG